MDKAYSSIGGYAQQAEACQAVRSRDFDEISARLSDLIDRAAKISAVASEVVGRLVGHTSTIEGSSGNTATPVPNGVIAETVMRLDDLSSVLSRIDGHVSRLSNV